MTTSTDDVITIENLPVQCMGMQTSPNLKQVCGLLKKYTGQVTPRHSPDRSC